MNSATKRKLASYGGNKTPFHKNNNKRAIDQMSLAPEKKHFSYKSGDRMAFRARVATAIQKRMYPNTTLQLKQLADAIGVVPETVGNWRNQYSDPSSFHMGALMAFFGISFWIDIYGPLGGFMKKRFENEIRRTSARLQEEAAMLKSLANIG